MSNSFRIGAASRLGAACLWIVLASSPGAGQSGGPDALVIGSFEGLTRTFGGPAVDLEVHYDGSGFATVTTGLVDFAVFLTYRRAVGGSGSGLEFKRGDILRPQASQSSVSWSSRVPAVGVLDVEVVRLGEASSQRLSGSLSLAGRTGPIILTLRRRPDGRVVLNGGCPAPALEADICMPG